MTLEKIKLITKKMEKNHKPVLLDEVLSFFGPIQNAHLQSSTIIDGTLGLGGHSAELIKLGFFVVGLDADTNYLEIARHELEKACPTTFSDKGGCFKIVHGNFKDIDLLIPEEKIGSIYGILFDLGVNSPQLTSSVRGMSFQSKDAPLDMRFDQENQAVTAALLINSLRPDQLDTMFRKTMTYGDTKHLVRKIIDRRQSRPLETVGDLTDIIGMKKYSDNTDPSTKPFLALRMAVNSELENLSDAIPKAFELLSLGGRLVIISFHSGEDAVVKNAFKKIALRGVGKIITRKPIVPSKREINTNPRARSAKMRVIEKKQ